MTIEEFFKVVDLTNISEFKINNQLVSLTYINTVLYAHKVDEVQITTKNMPFTTKDIKTIVVSDNIDDVVQYLNTESYLPNSPTYISICINIKIKKEGTYV
jgi:hypothetical protein